LVDGFHAASRIDRASRQCLSTVGVHAHASGNEGISIQPASTAPVLTYRKPQAGIGRAARARERDEAGQDSPLIQVRWNTADRAGLDIGDDWSAVKSWYDAAA
jgi:trimethyllysine dioxygenase